MTVYDLAGSRSFAHYFEERVDLHPDAPYLICEDRAGNIQEFTYGEFDERVNRMANGLADLGIQKGDKVTIHMMNSAEFITTWFALAKLGAVMVAANVLNTPREMQHLLSHSGSVAVVTEEAFLKVYEELLPELPQVHTLVLARSEGTHPDVVVFDDLLERSSPQRPVLAASADDVAELLFTSGTTAQPKAVMITHANLIFSAERVARGIHIDKGERCLTALPLFHVNGQGTFLYSMAVSGTAISIEMFSASTYWEQVRRHRATQTSIVAMQLRTLLAQPQSEDDKNHELRRVIYAINVSDQEKEAFEERFAVELINVYGLSEACTGVTMAPVFGARRWPSIGRPAFDRRVRLVDDKGNEVAVGEVGEIIVHGVPGRTIMKGYYKDEDATAKTIKDGWLYTGDNAYADEDGFFYFFDRKKDVIKRSGENISASEVEFALNEHPQVADCAVIGVPDPVRDEAVKAFIIPTEPGAVTEEEITEHCRERLAKFKIPTVFEFRESLPKTSVGKVQKKFLRTEVAE